MTTGSAVDAAILIWAIIPVCLGSGCAGSRLCASSGDPPHSEVQPCQTLESWYSVVTDMVGDSISFQHLTCVEVPNEQVRQEPLPFVGLVDPVPSGFRITFLHLAQAGLANQWVPVVVVQPDQAGKPGVSPLDLGLRRLHAQFATRVRAMSGGVQQPDVHKTESQSSLESTRSPVSPTFSQCVFLFHDLLLPPESREHPGSFRVDVITLLPRETLGIKGMYCAPLMMSFLCNKGMAVVTEPVPPNDYFLSIGIALKRRLSPQRDAKEE